MTDTPNYSFYMKPRFSANHLADYLCTQDAGQRDAVIRKAKFPRKIAVAAYQQVLPAFRSFLTSGGANGSDLDALSERLKAKASREEGYAEAEALRCIAAVDAFRVTYAAGRLGKIEFLAGPQDVTMKVDEVTVNVRLDPPIVERVAGEVTFGGGCVMFLASSPDTRKSIGDRLKYVAATAHWALEGGNLEPAPRICLAFDVFGNHVERAPTSFTRLRKRLTDACREAASKWDRIEPPSGYDGPDWR